MSMSVIPLTSKEKQRLSELLLLHRFNEGACKKQMNMEHNIDMDSKLILYCIKMIERCCGYYYS